MSDFASEFGGDSAPRMTKTRIEDIDGRAVVLFANEIRKMPGKTDPGKTYDAVFADVIVLDGNLNDEAGIESVPCVIENMMLTSGPIVGNLRNRVGRLDKPLIGRINSRRSQYGASRAYGIGELTPEDIAKVGDTAVKAKRQYVASRQNDEFDRPQAEDEPPPF